MMRPRKAISRGRDARRATQGGRGVSRYWATRQRGSKGTSRRFGGGRSVGMGRSELSGGRLVPSTRRGGGPHECNGGYPGTFDTVPAIAGRGSRPVPRTLACPPVNSRDAHQ